MKNRLIQLINYYQMEIQLLEQQAKNIVFIHLMNLIEKYPDKPWDWRVISSNPNLTIEMIEKYPDKPWNWKGISHNPNLTIEMIEKYPDKPWDWKGISYNSNITMEIIQKTMISHGIEDLFQEIEI